MGLDFVGLGSTLKCGFGRGSLTRIVAFKTVGGWQWSVVFKTVEGLKSQRFSKPLRVLTVSGFQNR